MDQNIYPSYSISPIQSDYYDTCSEMQNQLNSLQRTRCHLIDNAQSSAFWINQKCTETAQTLASSEQQKQSISYGGQEKSIKWSIEVCTYLYMVPGHTKFAPDLLFSEIAHRFYKTDAFNTKDL